jgi:hypothetical protein
MIMIRRCPYYLLLLIVFLWGCSSNEADSGQKIPPGVNSDSPNTAKHEPVYEISFTKEISFGSTDERLIGVRGWGNIITDEKNRAFIPDYRTNVIHVFDSTGQYITQMGGKGKGPGEYLYMSAFQITPDYLYIYGRRLSKITAYSLKDLAYSHTTLLNPDGWKDVERLEKRDIASRGFFVNNEGQILMAFNYQADFNLETAETEALNKNRTVQFYWLNRDGVVTSDMILEQRRTKRFVIDGWGSNAVTTFAKIFGEPLQAMTGDGVIAAGWSTQFTITIYDSAGRSKNSIEFPFKKTPLKRETLIEDHKSTYGYKTPRLKAYKTMDLPDNWPALKTMFFDDRNRLWVAAIIPNLNKYRWFIFNTDGKLLARFEWPRDKSIQEVKNGYMYTSKGTREGRRIIRYNMQMDKIKD